MKRATRWMLGLVTIASAIVLALAIISWPRSHRVSDLVEWRRSAQNERRWETRHLGLWTGQGKLVIYLHRSSSYRAEGIRPSDGISWVRAGPADPSATIPGYSDSADPLGINVVRDYWDAGSVCVVVPLWAVVTVAGVLPVLGCARLAQRWRSSRRGARGMCPQCGYDLRATPQRCPECGLERVMS